MLGGDDGHPEQLGQRGRDSRDAGTAPDRGDGGKVTRTNSVALQLFLNHFGKTLQRGAKDFVELVTGDPQIGTESRKVGCQRGDRAGGQPFLRGAALCTQPAQRADRRGPRQIDGARRGESVDHMFQQGLVDDVAGEIGMPHRGS